MTKEQQLEERVARLEIALAHHQRDYDSLNQVVTEQAGKIVVIQNQLSKLANRVQALELAMPESSPRSLEEDKPPHY